MSNMEITNCNQCPNQCPKDALKCGRGRRYFEQLENAAGDIGESKEGGYGRAEGRHGHGEGHFDHGSGRQQHGGREGGGGHARPEDLYGLMRACGHYLHHSYGERRGDDGDRQLFAALDEAEQNTLKELLKKLADSWER